MMRSTCQTIIRWVGLIGVVILLLTTSDPSSADSSKFDGKWVGEANSNLCFGASKFEFTVKDGVLEGYWSAGAARASARTEAFNAELDSFDKISVYAGDVRPVRVKGKFAGDSALGEISSSEYHDCMSFWQAKRVAGP